MIKRVLMALSGTPLTGGVIETAVDMAKRHDATLTGVTIVDANKVEYVGPVPAGAGGAAHELAEHRMREVNQHLEESIEAFSQAANRAGVKASITMEKGDPFHAFLSLWRYHDITIIGLKGLFEYGVIHNPKDHILKMIAHGLRPLIAAPKTARPVKQVYIAYNGRMESAKAMKGFIGQGVWTDVKIRIGTFNRNEAEGRALVEDAAAYVSAHGYDVDTEVVDGDPHKILLDRVHNCNADMLVMGATSRSKLARLIWGDTLLAAMMSSDVPIYVSQ